MAAFGSACWAGRTLLGGVPRLLGAALRFEDLLIPWGVDVLGEQGAVYPDSTWYTQASASDVADLAEALKQGMVVQRLKYEDGPAE